MPLATIPRNTYPLLPSGYVGYWQAAGPDSSTITRTGRVPVWATYHDGGPRGRLLHVLVIRVRPNLEVVLVGEFQHEQFVDDIERAIRERLTKPHWPERKWWVSHVVYVAQPPKRRPIAARRRLAFNFQRFCMGQLVGPDRDPRMLAFIPVSRLKVNVNPDTTPQKAGQPAADIWFEVDQSNQQRRNVRMHCAHRAELERWERGLVDKALCHLLGKSYVDVSILATEEIGGDAYTLPSQSAVEAAFRKRMQRAPEDFHPIRWLRPPSTEGERQSGQMILTITRFPMGAGPDAEMSVRPWIPEELRGVIGSRMPVEPYSNIALQVAPDPENGDVVLRWVINPLAEYGLK